MSFLLQLLNGIQLGSIYALIALGYNMVYGIVKLINFAHGDLIMVGAYTAFVCLAMLYLPLWATVLLIVLMCVVFGVLIQLFAYRPLLNRHAPRISLLITALGVSMLLENGVAFVFKPDAKPLSLGIDMEPFTIGSISIGFATIATVVVSVICMIALVILVNKTKMGKAMRAVSEDPQAAQLMGINVNTTISFTFATGSALAGISSIFYTMSYPQIAPFMGSMLGLKAFVAAVLGGIGSIPGAMLGGMLLGIAESLTKAYISTVTGGVVSSQWADAVVFAILIVTLLVKPSGILGKNVREKV